MRLRAIGLTPRRHRRRRRSTIWAAASQMRAPIGGTVIERKVTLGQAVERATDAFKIADTTHVWVSLDLYEKDLDARARRPGGRDAHRRAAGRDVPRRASRSSCRVIDEATRTAKVRLEFANPNGQLHAGPAGDGAHRRRSEAARPREVLAVPRSAVEQVEGKTVVFVQGAATAFERRNVLLGTSGGDRVEIRKGLARGRAGRDRRRVPAQERASAMSPGRASSSFAVRRRGVVLVVWAAVVRRRARRRCASCPSTPSPTSPTRRCRSSPARPGCRRSRSSSTSPSRSRRR